MGVGHARGVQALALPPHNFQHHKYTNILGMDDDVGYSTLRVTRDQPWKGYTIGNMLFNTILALGFEWGIGVQPIEFGKILKDGSDREPRSGRSANSQPRPEGSWSRTTRRVPGG